MAVPHKITNYLSRNFASYRHKKHPVAFTAMETAAAEHVPGRELAKSVVLKADDHLIMAVLPADHLVNMRALKRKIGADRLSLASEAEFSDLFLPCEAGAMPPFGKLFGFQTYCDRPLAGQLEIEFNAGTHFDTIRMPFSEFERLESPEILDFSDKFTGQRMARTA
jgi:Ala-tRNA(Pro) deacylase